MPSVMTTGAEEFLQDWPPLKLKASSADYYFDSYNHYGVHEDILHDAVTIPAYQQAIQQNAHLFKDKVVLEVSAGLGLCSLFAAKAGAARVIAMEVHPELVEIGNDVARKNGYAEVLQFICGTPSSIGKLPWDLEAVDIIVSVFMGYCLLYEARLPEVLQARDRWLKPSGLIFPDRAKLFVSLVEDPEYKRHHYDYYDQVWGFDFSAMKEAAKSEPVVQACEQKSLLSSSTCVLNLDLHRCTVADCYEMAAQFKLRCRREGNLDGLITWSTATCWKQTIFFFQGLTRRVCSGDDVHCMLAVKKLVEGRRHMDVKVAFKINGGSQQMHYFRWM
mmetsp:Transcript_56017/g.130975  ORF Transcript_56017/g.130975 Transcript_56017/m.130975 type:complete len:332 (-) Transcript_56017:139-1134(-)